MSKAMVVALMALGLLMGCGEEGDGGGSGGGCERPEGPPTMEGVLVCNWGPDCAGCVTERGTTAYYEASEDMCGWALVFDANERTQVQADLLSACTDTYDSVWEPE